MCFLHHLCAYSHLDFSFFFFYCSVHHLNLHSFPTRRSSDLNSYSALVLKILSRSSLRFCSTSNLSNAEARSAKADRKSTRLNSSHVSISYAVFCLKKKNKTSLKTYLTNLKTITGQL